MDDFMKSVKEEDLLLEAFGPCLPDTKVQYHNPQLPVSSIPAAIK